jgi:hypothetical protein
MAEQKCKNKILRKAEIQNTSEDVQISSFLFFGSGV